VLTFLVVAVISGFIVGALARFAVPGPDPMPWWATILLGIAGSILGGLVAGLLGIAWGGFPLALAGAIAVLIAYRRWVQRRPITGPSARRRLP
jgi:uncharacterized membrane protein YeaQ/YmgE (transglycosylase-associated protein family)